jgi:uncharacterized membrane protein HdeD (DUF308 family)
MLRALSDKWWTFVARGVFAILYGVLTFILPELTLIVLVLMFGGYILIDGLFAIIMALTRREEFNRWWWALIEGVFGVTVGILTFVWPGITGLVLLILIAAWAIVTGLLEIGAAIQLRRVINNEWLLAFSGLISVGLGIAVLVWPGAGAVALAWLIGVYAIIFGITLIALGIRLKNWEPSQRPVISSG